MEEEKHDTIVLCGVFTMTRLLANVRVIADQRSGKENTRSNGLSVNEP